MSLVITRYQNDLCSPGIRQGAAGVKDTVECVISILCPVNYPLNK